MRVFAKIRSLRAFLLENAGVKQTVFKNTFWLTISTLGGRIIRAVLLIYVARILGTAGYGVFSYAVGLAAFFSIFSDIGVSGMLTREGARHPEAFPQYLGTSLVLKICLLLFTNIILFAAIPFFNKIPEALQLLPLAALLISFDGLRDLAFSITRAKERMEIEAVITVVTNLAITALGIALLILRPTPYALMAGYTVGSGIGTLVAFILLRRYFIRFWTHVRKNLMWPIIREGFPFALAGLLGSLMLNTDMVVLGWLADEHALGLYSAAQRPIQLLYMIPNIMAIALFPSFSRFALQEPARFRQLFERAISLAILVALPIALGGILLGDNLTVLLFGNDFLPAAPAMKALFLTLLMNYPSMFLGNAVFAHNKQRSLVWFLSLGAIGNFIFNYLFIPQWGILGCAFATVLAQLISNGFAWWKMKQLTGFTTLTHLPKIILAAAVMGYFVWLLNWAGLHVIWNVIISGGLYFGVLFALREKLLLQLTSLASRKLAKSP